MGKITGADGQTYYTADKSYVGVKKNGDIWRSDFDRYLRSKWKYELLPVSKTLSIVMSEELGAN